MLDIGGANNTG